MDILVFGAGSLGSLLGGLLARYHEVTLVGRDPHVSAVADGGLHVDGAIEAMVHPRARTTVPSSTDLVLVTVKSYDTEAAGRSLAACDPEVALSLQNGMGNEETLAAHLDCPVLAGTATYGALLESPGSVRCTGIGEVVLGRREGGESAVADRVGTAFAESDIETTVAADMPRRLWEKLAVNAGINATTALARVENGALVDGPARETARAAARETTQVARKQGVDLTPAEAVDALDSVAATTAENTSSMQQDVLGERRTEVDAINGYVVEAAAESVPVNRTLTALLRAWEAERGLR